MREENKRKAEMQKEREREIMDERKRQEMEVEKRRVESNYREINQMLKRIKLEK